MTETEKIAAALFCSDNPTADMAIRNVMREQRQRKSHKQHTIDIMLAIARRAGYRVASIIELEERRTL